MIIHHIIIVVIVTDSMYISCLVHVSQATKVPVCHCPSNIKDISAPEHNGSAQILGIILLQSDTWLHQTAYWGRRAQKRHRPDCFHPLKGPFKTISGITKWHDFETANNIHPGARARWALEEFLRNAVSQFIFSLQVQPHRLLPALQTAKKSPSPSLHVLLCQNHFQDRWVLHCF